MLIYGPCDFLGSLLDRVSKPSVSGETRVDHAPSSAAMDRVRGVEVMEVASISDLDIQLGAIVHCQSCLCCKFFWYLHNEIPPFEQ